MPVKNRFADMHDEIAAWRRDLHAHPELLFETHRTAALVAERLREFGCDEVVTGIGRTGVVGLIRGRETGSGRVVGLRADMDALPIDERTGVAYASQTPGVMHACGHDGHTAMLLGAARYLAETRNFNGTVAVIFQPAEEGGGGGREMCEDGLMTRFGVDEVYGMHNWPGLAPGRFAIRPGVFFAAVDTIAIDIEGKGAHAAEPQNGVDPCVIAAQLIGALQTVVSRNAPPTGQLVVSITGMQSASQAFNVIPSSVRLVGTVRSMDAGLSALAERRIRAIGEGVGAAFGGCVALTYRRDYPAMRNHPEETALAAEVARDISGQCDEAPLVMGGEDFAFMLEERPGAYILIGNGDSAMIHHPGYDFNDAVIPSGCSWWVGLAEARMPL